MLIKKRNGKLEKLKIEKIQSRIKKQTYNLDTNYIDADEVAIKVTNGLYDGVTTKELDELAGQIAFSMTTKHPDYSYLASRIALTSLYKEESISDTFSETIERMYNYVHPITKEKAGIISDDVYEFIMEHSDILDSEIVKDRDFLFDYFGFKTLERAYLLKLDGQISETPQYMIMRVACGIWGGKDGDIQNVIKTYEYMSSKYFIHATPTLFNSGTIRPQMSSCFLLTMNEDSIKGIYKTLGDVAHISKYAGGIGLSIHNVRGKNSYIKGTNGYTDGIIPMMRVFNETARYVNQAGKRKGSFAIYIEPWHSDIEDFLKTRTNTGKEEMKTRDLFTALWIPDLFFDRVIKDQDWTLFSPDTAKGLSDVYGDEFNELYEKYEREGLGVKTVKARHILELVDKSRIETGVPYMMSKDSSNRKSNQNNLGTIKSSNLCTEIIEYSSPDESAVCNLGSIAVNMFVNQDDKRKKPTYDFDKLYEITYQLAVNLDRVIDRNFYPIEETKNSNSKHRPVGIGVQGLADCFALMGFPFDSDEAKQLNKDIFETIYYAALKASNDLAVKLGKYSSFEGSLASKGILQFDLWKDTVVEKVDYLDENEEPILDDKGEIINDWAVTEEKPVKLSGRWDFDTLKESIIKNGLRNSLSIAPMPTASTSQILGNTESFQPFNRNIYKRETLAGQFTIVNHHLVKDLCKLNLWNDDIKNKIIFNEGSIQEITEIPVEIRDKFKTVWDIKQKDLIDMSADRGAFICQSQSFNLFLKKATIPKLRSATVYAFKKGLKTLSYYVHTTTDTSTNKTLGVQISENAITPKTPIVEPEPEPQACSLDNPDCLACSA